MVSYWTLAVLIRILPIIKQFHFFDQAKELMVNGDVFYR